MKVAAVYSSSRIQRSSFHVLKIGIINFKQKIQFD